MNFILIVIAIAVYYLVPKLMNYVHQHKEKYPALSLYGVILSAVSAILSSSFMTFFLLLITYLFFAPEIATKHALSFFSTFLAIMIGAELVSESPPDFSHHIKAAIFLILIGLVLWPATHFAAQLLDKTFTSVALYNEAGIIEYSALMIVASLTPPQLLN